MTETKEVFATPETVIPRMTKAQAKVWIAALRSGDYKQGYRALKSTSSKGVVSYCCLGVAKEVLKLDNVTHPCCLADGSISDRGKDLYLNSGEQGTLITLNDGMGGNGSFTSIAQYIEEQILPILPD